MAPSGRNPTGTGEPTTIAARKSQSFGLAFAVEARVRIAQPHPKRQASRSHDPDRLLVVISFYAVATANAGSPRIAPAQCAGRSGSQYEQPHHRVLDGHVLKNDHGNNDGAIDAKEALPPISA